MREGLSWKNKGYFAFLVLCLLNFLDFYVTFLGIGKYGIEAEANQNFVLLIENYGWVIAAIVKLFGVPLSGLPLLFSIKRSDNNLLFKVYFYVLQFGIAAYLYIVAWWVYLLI